MTFTSPHLNATADRAVPPRPARRSTRRLGFWLVLLAGLVGGAEAILQLAALSSRSANRLLSVETIYAAVADPQLVWRGNPEYPDHDRLGFRNGDVPHQADFVALGDSQTYGSKLGAGQSWPHQVQRLSGVRSYNMGFAGWGPQQGLLMLDEALAMRPRTVAYALFAGNDLVDSYTFVYHRKKLTELRSADQQTVESLKQAERAEPWDGEGIWDQRPTNVVEKRKKDNTPESAEELLAEYSRLYGLANAVRRAYDYYERRPIWADPDDQLDTSREYIRYQGPRFKTVLDPTYRFIGVDLSDPRVVEGLRIAQETFSLMHERSKAAGVNFMVVYIPTKELTLSRNVYAELAEVPPAYSQQVESEQAVRERLGAYLAAEQIPFVDTAPVLQELAQNGTLPYSATKDGHLNLEGQRAVAELVLAATEGR